MIYTKIPRKLKKGIKKLILKSHSKSFLRMYKLKAKHVRIKYLDKDRNVVSNKFSKRLKRKNK